MKILEKIIWICVILVTVICTYAFYSYGAEIMLQWDANTEADLKHYSLYKCVVSNYDKTTGSTQMVAWEWVADIPAPTTQYTYEENDSGVFYYITAVNLLGEESGPSNLAARMLRPGNPKNLK